MSSFIPVGTPRNDLADSAREHIKMPDAFDKQANQNDLKHFMTTEELFDLSATVIGQVPRFARDQFDKSSQPASSYFRKIEHNHGVAFLETRSSPKLIINLTQS